VSRVASHEPETIVALLFEQPLDFELSFGGSVECDPQMHDLLPIGRSALESRLDEHKARASQNSVDQKEILEPVHMNSRNPPPFHSHFPALFVAKSAKGNRGINICYFSSELSRHPTKYGDMCAQVDSSAMRFVPNPGTLSGTHPYNPRSSILHSGAFA